MFTTNDKFISIPDLRRAVLEAKVSAERKNPEDYDLQQFWDEIDQDTINVMAGVPRGFLLSPSGSVVQVGPGFLQRSTYVGHLYVNINTGLTEEMRRGELDQHLSNDDLVFIPKILRGASFLLAVAGITFWLTTVSSLVRDVAQYEMEYPHIFLMFAFYTAIAGGALYAARHAKKKEHEYIERRGDTSGALKGFEGMSLMLERVEVEKILAPEAEQTTASIAEEDRVARRIVSHVEGHGPKLKRSDAAVMFGGNLGTRAFGRAWSKATAQHPALGRPGPKG